MEPIDFLISGRGRLIMAQALYHGIKALESVEPEIMQEKSNIEDMRYLRDNLFNYPDLMFDPAKLQEAVIMEEDRETFTASHKTA